MHCDTLMQAWFRGRRQVWHLPSAMLDGERLAQGGAKGQFFAIFLQSMRLKRLAGPLLNDGKYIERLAGIFYRTLAKHPDQIAYAGNFDQMQQNWHQGKISAFLTIEDGREVRGRMERLAEYHRMGVRLLGLTWNYRNCFGFPNSTDEQEMRRGLTRFGKEAVGELNRLGILIDVSHLSDGGFWDVARLSKKPFVASHSNARALCPVSRNLTDEMIRAVGNAGGVVGLNQCPAFLYPGSRENRIEDLTAHLRHIANAGGIECAALGSDFDGINNPVEFGNASGVQQLYEALVKSGFSEDDADKIFYKNVLRVYQDVLK